MSDEFPPEFERKKVNGKTVVTDEVLASGLSGYLGKLVPIRGTRVLTLSDGSVVHGCAQCPFTGTRGEVTGHRVADHGAGMGGHRTKRAAESAPAGPSARLDDDLRSMSVGEIVDLAAHIDDWETILTGLEERLAEAIASAAEESKTRRVAERELAVLKRRLKRLMGDE